MSKGQSFASILAICATATTPAFAVGGGANWNTGFLPTFNTQEYGNQGPTGLGGSQARPPANRTCRDPGKRTTNDKGGVTPRRGEPRECG